MAATTTTTMTSSLPAMKIGDDTKVDSVTVYENNAKVSRSFKINPANVGIHEITISGFCDGFNYDSLRLTGTSSCHVADVSVSNVHVRRGDEPGSDATQKEIKDIIDKIKVISTSVKKLALRKSLLEEQRSLVKSHVEKQLASTPHKGYTDFVLVDTNNATALLAVYAKISEETLEKLEAIEKEGADLELQFRVLESRLMQLTNCYWRNENIHASVKECLARINYHEDMVMKPQAKVTFDVLAMGEHEINISYLVHSCSWSPSYDVRAGVEDKELRVDFFGKIIQRSGEDWKDVSIALSTAQITDNCIPPELLRHEIQFKQPVEYQAQGAASRARMPRGGMLMMECAAAAPAMMDCMMVVEKQGTSVSYRIPGKSSVASDGASHKVPIATLMLPCVTILSCIPSACDTVFLKSQAKNTSEYHLLKSHDASVYIDGTYSGKTQFKKTITPEEIFHLPLTVDPTITITHIPERVFDKETGLIMKGQTRICESKTFITFTRSNHAVSSLVVIGSYPMTTESKISVKLQEPIGVQSLEESTDDEAAAKALATSRGASSCFLNKTSNHLFHVVPVGRDSSQVKLVTRYLLEWPADKEIEIREA